MKNLFKTRLLPLMLAAVMVLSMTACGDSGAGSASSGPALMTEDAYAEEVKALNDDAAAFVAALQTFMSEVAANPDDLDNAVALMEDAKATAQPFLDFVAIDNPPKGFEDAHATLSEGAQLAADTISTYCDVVIDSLKNSTAVSEEAITDYETNMTRVAELIDNGMTAVEDLISK